VIEDDADIRGLLGEVLRQGGLEVHEAATGADGLDWVRRIEPDLVTLDLNLPDMDGIEVCRELRRSSGAYVMMLTARNDEIDLLVGLEVGADDYMTKPFSARELRARVAAMFRRPRAGGEVAAAAKSGTASRLVLPGELEIDLDAYEVRHQGRLVALTVTEFRILAALASQPNRVWTREALLREVWDTDWSAATHLVEVHVGNLRRKLGSSGADGGIVRTVRGIGYRLAPS